MTGGVELSVVVPAYNEEARLTPTLRRIVDYLDRRGARYEVLVVDDGSTDRTVAVARELAAGHPAIEVLELGMNRGKGAAVRQGMLSAIGRLVLFSDADLATPIEELERLRAEIDAGHDIAIASRAMAQSDIRARQHPLRELMGRGFNVLVRAIALGGFRDTQCGFKLFTREAAHDLFARATVEGFAFDVEVLLLARDRYRIAEVPVTWSHVEESKLSPGSDAARMFWDLVRIRTRLGRG